MNSMPGKTKSPIKDGEVGTPEHDNLLLWLRSNLDKVVNSLWGTGSFYFNQRQQEALNNWYQEISKVMQSCESAAKDHEYASDVRAAYTSKAKELRDFLASTPIPDLDRDSHFTTVDGYSLQVPVNAENNKVLGYVDLKAEITAPLRLDLPAFNFLDDDIFRHDVAIPDFEPSYDSDSERVKAIRSVAPITPVWDCVMDNKTILFDVRITIGAIGEYLRALKQLRAHSRKNTTICVVCDCIDPTVADILKHEGFWVFDRKGQSSGGVKLKVVK